MQAAALVQTRFETIDPELLEGVLTRRSSLTRPEIMRVTRRERGILHENLPLPIAIAIADEMAGRNVGLTAVPVSELPPVSRPRSALWIEPDVEGFGVPLDHRQVLERIEWSSVFAIHAEMLRDPQSKLERAGGARAQAEASHISTKLIERFPNVDVVGITAVGKLVHFRIAQSRFAPARMPWIVAEQPLLDRYYQLLELLLQRSTSAIISPAARRMLLERPGASHSLADHWNEEADDRGRTNYIRWLIWLAMHQERQATK